MAAVAAMVRPPDPARPTDPTEGGRAGVPLPEAADGRFQLGDQSAVRVGLDRFSGWVASGSDLGPPAASARGQFSLPGMANRTESRVDSSGYALRCR